MKAISIAWRVIVNLLALAVIFATLESGHTEFEAVVVSSLVLIYEAIVWNSIVLSRQALAMERSNIARFLELRALAGQPTTPEESEHLTEIGQKLEAPGSAFWINAGGISLASIAAIWRLVAAVI